MSFQRDLKYIYCNISLAFTQHYIMLVAKLTAKEGVKYFDEQEDVP